MDGKILAHAIAHTRGEDLRAVYALLFKTNAFDVVSAKTKELFNKRIDHFSYSIKDEMKKLEGIDEGELQLQLISQLAKLVGIKGMRLDTAELIEWQCDHIMHAVHHLLVAEEPAYGQFRGDGDELIYETLIHFQMQKLFHAFEEKFQQLNDHDALLFANELLHIIEQQPRNTQLLMYEQLGLTEPTGGTLLAKMREHGTILTCSTIVEYVGFTGYVNVTSAIANTMTISGVVLPFGLYTFAAALLSVVLNPVFLLPVLLSSGGYLFTQQTKALQKRLMPIALVQLLLPVLSDKQRSIGTPDFQPMLQAWQQHITRYESYEQAIVEQQELMKQLQTNIDSLTKTILLYEQQLTVQMNEQQVVYDFIRAEMFDIPSVEQTLLYKQLRADLQMVELDIEGLKLQQKKNKAQTGIWSTITATIDNTKLAGTIRMQTKELERLHEALCNEVISSQPPLLADPILKYNGIDYECKRLKDALENEQEQLALENEKLATAKQAIKLLEKQMRTMEKNLYGLADLNAQQVLPDSGKDLL